MLSVLIVLVYLVLFGALPKMVPKDINVKNVQKLLSHTNIESPDRLEVLLSLNTGF